MVAVMSMFSIFIRLTSLRELFGYYNTGFKTGIFPPEIVNVAQK
jgi:hypothetical protein